MSDPFDFGAALVLQPVTAFRGPYRFLSNFWPCEVEFEGLSYSSTEHAYQAAKTLDPVKRAAISIAATPGEAKKIGKTLVLRPDWDAVKLQIMEGLLRQKFAKPENAKLLCATGAAILMEGNTWGDEFWGCVHRDGVWVGQNNLGKLLMKIRTELL